ncbi:unnamed protein product [Cuscuta campestris]|uniref:Uncharacterized protein n=1 Tax=Cuscuta campestris TaxID=132261 RepID=A0A484MXN0_9ASTE|nr:unnamed protein product [Cuscuta campestris]
MKKVGDKLIPKTEDEFDAEDIKKVENYAKAINMLYCAVNPDDYRKIYCCSTAKEMLDKLEVTYEGTDQVREAKIDFLTQEYEMFRMKEHEKIDNMFDRFSKIVNNLHALKKTYTDRDLVRKILRSLTSEWRSKADAIYESIGTSNVTIDGLRDTSRAATSGKSKSKSREPATNSEERLYFGDGSYLWFDSEEERTRFLTFFSKRVVAPSRIVSERLPELQGYDNLDAQFHQTGLWSFVSRTRKEINLALIRVFYSNLWREDDVLHSFVKSKPIELTVEQLGASLAFLTKATMSPTESERNGCSTTRALSSTSLASPSSSGTPRAAPPSTQRKTKAVSSSTSCPGLSNPGSTGTRSCPATKLWTISTQTFTKRSDNAAPATAVPRRTATAPGPAEPQARANLASIADSLNRLHFKVDGMDGYLERLDEDVQRQGYAMNAYFQRVNYVPHRTMARFDNAKPP